MTNTLPRQPPSTRLDVGKPANPRDTIPAHRHPVSRGKIHAGDLKRSIYAGRHPHGNERHGLLQPTEPPPLDTYFRIGPMPLFEVSAAYMRRFL
jgi:hypothetical protein